MYNKRTQQIEHVLSTKSAMVTAFSARNPILFAFMAQKPMVFAGATVHVNSALIQFITASHTRRDILFELKYVQGPMSFTVKTLTGRRHRDKIDHTSERQREQRGLTYIPRVFVQ